MKCTNQRLLTNGRLRGKLNKIYQIFIMWTICRYFVKLSNFGLQDYHRIRIKKNFHTTSDIGYTCPEILQDPLQAPTTANDIWSVGLILFTMLYSFNPFEKSNVISTWKQIEKAPLKFPSRPKISIECKQLLANMLWKDPNIRLNMFGPISI